MRKALPLAAAAVLLAGLGACSNVGYYAQSVSGQLDVWRRCRPIEGLLEDPQAPDDLKGRLADVLALREFATRELHLPDNGSYRKYADLGRPYVLWNVFAAPEFSTELKTWCFPFAGCVRYRGYFSRDQAERFADGLRKEGYDVYVGGVPAYSTLGWFKDPVLNTFLGYSKPRLAEFLFHELAHQELYVKGDTEFNESFATAVAREGVRRWLAATGSADPSDVEKVERRREQWVALVLAYRRRLEALYASGASDSDKREEKAHILESLREGYLRLKKSWDGYDGYDRWFARDLNNAKLGSVAAYTRLVPAFQRLLAEEKGDLARFYEEARALGNLPVERRHARLEALTGRSGDAAGTVAGAEFGEGEGPGAPGEEVRNLPP